MRKWSSVHAGCGGRGHACPRSPGAPHGRSPPWPACLPPLSNRGCFTAPVWNVSLCLNSDILKTPRCHTDVAQLRVSPGGAQPSLAVHPVHWAVPSSVRLWFVTVVKLPVSHVPGPGSDSKSCACRSWQAAAMASMARPLPCPPPVPACLGLTSQAPRPPSLWAFRA